MLTEAGDRNRADGSRWTPWGSTRVSIFCAKPTLDLDYLGSRYLSCVLLAFCAKSHCFLLIASTGLFGCAFTLGRTLGFRPWRTLRRRRGERTALVASLVLSAVFSLLFGAAPSFPAAVLARLFLGMSNGVSGAVKRAAVDAARAENRRRSAYMVVHTRDAELVLEEHEAAATESVLSVMAWGMAAGPWAGGVLCSDPRDGRYGPGSEHGASGGYPFLGPNLLAAGLCLLSAVSVAAVVSDRPTGKRGGGNAKPERKAVTFRRKVLSWFRLTRKRWRLQTQLSTTVIRPRPSRQSRRSPVTSGRRSTRSHLVALPFSRSASS